MRRENRRRAEDGLEKKKMLYITGGILALAIIAFVISFLIYGNKLSKTADLAKLNTQRNSIGNLTQIEDVSSNYGKTVNEVQESENKTDSKTENKEENKNTEKIAVNTSQTSENNTANKNTNEVKKQDTNKNNETTGNKTVTKKEEKVKDPEFKMPVSGEIMKEFADNKLVYSNTLDVWATHNGIDIKADETTVVKAAADGKVISIKNDPRYGLTVIIEHVNGYKTIYANLLSTEFIVEGEEVKQGQSIGTVGSTASFEISDEAHLHFELLKDNEEQDPELYLKK